MKKATKGLTALAGVVLLGMAWRERRQQAAETRPASGQRGASSP